MSSGHGSITAAVDNILSIRKVTHPTSGQPALKLFAEGRAEQLPPLWLDPQTFDNVTPDGEEVEDAKRREAEEAAMANSRQGPILKHLWELFPDGATAGAAPTLR